MKKLVTSALILMASYSYGQSVVDTDGPTPASADNISIRCDSDDKKISLIGSLPKDLNHGDVAINISGKSYNLKQSNEISSTEDVIQTVTDVINGVFTVSSEGRDQSVKRVNMSLSSIPKTMTGKHNGGRFQISFRAKFNFTTQSTEASCADGCIVMPVEAESVNSFINQISELNCKAAY